ncbi:hypothetical protein [Cupriavidus sp. IDO]|uniref:hypothetical protein n=1 Tax=Cupriavidus sp. IDO TaxID=1539142 RepID=UPI00187BE9DB
MFSRLVKDQTLSASILTIVADEVRGTFEIANLFRQVRVLASWGQVYETEDSASVLLC